MKSNKKTILTIAGIIIIAAIIITVSLVCKKSGPSTIQGAKVTLCDYKKIPLTLEKKELTDEDIKTTAQWSLDYYNQGLQSSDASGEAAGEELSLDTLTDKQVKKAFGYESVDEFYENIKKQREESDEQSQRTSAYEQLCNYLVDKCTIENFPEDKCKERLDKQLENTKEQCETSYDMTFAEYCKSTGMTEDEYTKSLSEHVERNYKIELIFTAIGDKENIQYDEDAWNEYLKNLIANGGFESEEDVYEKYGEDYLKTAYRVEYITDWLIDKADITYTEPEETTEAEVVEPETVESEAEEITESTDEVTAEEETTNK